MSNVNPPPVDAAEFRRMSRRQLLALAPLAALGTLAFPRAREWLLKRGLAFSDWASAQLFDPARLAPTFRDDQLTPLANFPINAIGEAEPEIDFGAWALVVEGLVRRPGNYSLDTIRALPKVTQNIRHVCIEGWSVLADFGGARLADFLAHVGADAGARFVEVSCYDDYYTSFDMASCRHPQTLLCYEMYGRPLERARGAPLRVHMPTKLGYKSAKYLFSLRVTNTLRQPGFWEDQGYSWHGGI
jgi:DMSO/TMAO reductase YedYZ molybdopterin-dependent catalytic subunit